MRKPQVYQVVHLPRSSNLDARIIAPRIGEEVPGRLIRNLDGEFGRALNRASCAVSVEQSPSAL